MQKHTKPLSIAEARRLILATVSDTLEDRAVLRELADVAGCVLAEDVFADRDAPPFDRAMMDGFALNSDDFASRSADFAYALAGETIFAGKMPREELEAGSCRRIMTGAPLPPGADCVIPLEESESESESLSVSVSDSEDKSESPSETAAIRFPGVADPTEIRPLRFVAPRGKDLQSGQRVLAAGAALDAAAMNVLASVGCAQVPVRRPPRCVVLSTGDEIVAAGTPSIRPEQIRDSNYYALCAGLAAYRVPLPEHRIVPDQPEALAAAVEHALHISRAELLILSGGVSMGDADFVPGILAAAGIQKIFHRVNVKPGKPLWFGQGQAIPGSGKAPGPVVFGLPGNPVAVQVGWKLFIEAWLRAWFGLGPAPAWSLPLCEERRKRGDRPEFFPARLVPAPAGDARPTETNPGEAFEPQVQPMRINSSGDVSATVGSSGFALHPGDRDRLQPGERVLFYPQGRLD